MRGIAGALRRRGSGRLGDLVRGQGPPDAASPPAAGSAEHAAELAELHAREGARTQEEVALARSPDGTAASAYWTELALAQVAARSAGPGMSPPRVARGLAMLEIAMHDALVVTWAAKACYQRPSPAALDPSLSPVVRDRGVPAYPSEHAALAGVAQVILPALFPDAEDELVALGERGAWSRLTAGAAHRSDVEAGLALGRAVARSVLEAREGDGSATTSAVAAPAGPCIWRPTPPAFREGPLEPHWGGVAPFLMERGSQFRPPPPPACDSAEFHAQTEALHRASLALTPEERDLAQRWAGGPGTVTPPGMWLWMALNETRERELSTMMTARVMSHVAAALADAAIAAWDAKFTYWYERPVTTIRERIDPAWSPLLPTPPFPGYVSGHATFAGAATETLSHLFPEARDELTAVALEASASRFYGGIHIGADNEEGLALGRSIGELAAARAARAG
ncbi:MAG TPA: phosphatase PAP2 family protein [Candidatus Thermoplasmatota archaeon]|nr:phosphatase PAP2 family protein [Candidatus Thermoplasmatota archaeon]